MNRNKKLANMAMLVALAMIFSYVESLIPINFGVPGMKLGVANLVTVTGLYFLKTPEVLAVSVLRVLLTGFIFGNGMSIIYSLAGAVVSLLAMALVKKMDGISIVGVSITGGVFHNIGQILVAMSVVENLKLIYYLPVLLVAGTVTGFVIGIVAGKQNCDRQDLYVTILVKQEVSMKNKEMKVKAMSMAVAMSMVVGLCPSTIFAATGSQTTKDGTYTKTAHVARTAEDDENEDECNEYDVEVSLKVEDGKFSAITVTPGEGYNAESDSYFAKAVSKSKGIQKMLVGKAATEDTINGWDSVSGATRTSKAVKEAALAAIKSANEAVTVDTTKLEAAITAAEALKEADYTADSWSAMQTKLTVAKAALKAKESQSAVDTAADELNAAVKALKKAEVAKETYVLMNIPYSEFYAADKVAGADSVSSATKAKTRSKLVAGSYHVNSDGTDITGITYPVKISDASVLKNYTQITDDSKLSITVNMKGKETTTEYNGKDALFESASYSYYILSETPSYYKEATVNADGSFSFSEVKGATAQKLSDASIDFTTDTKYGDYELDVNGLPDTVNTVYGVVISTKEGDNYGLRHLENIWKKKELAWSTGFVTTSHGNTLNSKDYEKMMGQTINKITYYTDNGIYEIDADQYVPIKFNGTIAAENADVKSGKVNVTVEGLPGDYQAEYTVEGLEDAQVKEGVLTYKTKGAETGRYTLKVSDKSGKYADLKTDFELTTEAVPVVFNSESAALVAAEGYAADDVTSYVKKIKSVTVDGTEYAATGKRAVKIIKEDGTIDTTAAPFKNAENGQEFKITVKATGYAKDCEFTYTVAQESEYTYAYVGLSWAEYWAAENVQAAGDTSSSDAKDSKGESDKGAFDTVTRATVNHGLHRGSFQCNAVIKAENGKEYAVEYWTDGTTAVLTDGSKITFNRGEITEESGATTKMTEYDVLGLKYVPVKVKTSDLDALKASYRVIENGSELAGGYSEKNLVSYTGLVANVTENTNGLKTATKNENGSFSFSARVNNGSESGIKDQALKTAPTAEKAGLTVKEASGSYGEFLRVDLTGNYGDLGSNLQTVTWTYYGDDSTYTNAKATYGTKFAADNWMHKAMGIQLGLTDSLRCTLPEGTDGTGYWTITLTALGYNDVTYKFQATEENIVKASENEKITTTELEAAIAKAEALKEAEYTAESWASMQMELQEAKDELKNPKTQATVDEAVSHLNAAIEALVKIEEPAAVDTSSLEKVISDAAALKEADYTVDSWKALQSALTDAKSALNAKESQEKVDKATDKLNSAIKALVKNGKQDGSQNGSATPTVTKKAGTTTDGSASKGTSGSKAAKTGDPANVLGLLGLAFSSLGAGVGGFAWKRKRK